MILRESPSELQRQWQRSVGCDECVGVGEYNGIDNWLGVDGWHGMAAVNAGKREHGKGRIDYISYHTIVVFLTSSISANLRSTKV